MAVQFDGSAVYYSGSSFTVLSGEPDFSMDYWSNMDVLPSTAAGNYIQFVAVASNNGFQTLLDDSFNGTTDTFRAVYLDPTQSNRTNTTASLSTTGQWYNLHPVFSRLVSGMETWVDGTEDSSTPVGVNQTANTWSADVGVGATQVGGSYHDGAIQNMAFFKHTAGVSFDSGATYPAHFSALKDHNFSPLFWRDNLVCYFPLWGPGYVTDLRQGYVLTENGSPTKAPGPAGVIYPTSGSIFFAPAGGGGGGSGIKWNGVDIKFNGLANDKWNGYV